MFYILEKKAGNLKIVCSYKDSLHRFNNLLKYCNELDITCIDSFDNVINSGLYCSKICNEGKDIYEIREYFKTPDGYILYGSLYYEYKYEIEILFYDDVIDFRNVINQIKK